MATRSSRRRSEPRRTFDARSVSRRMRHDIVYKALDAMPAGEALRYIGLQYPVAMMEQLEHRYGERLAQDFVESDAEHVVIDFSLD
jgi:uncharacterized protein (DUF2249 family)